MSIQRIAMVPVLVSLAACGGIGDGNGPEELTLSINGATEDAEVFRCSTQLPTAALRFTNNTQGDVATRAQWTSSDPEVLDVSDGGVEAPSGFFVNGALLPKQPGSVTLTGDFLDGQFVDTIDVTVSPAQLELSPVRVIALPNRSVSIVDTLVREGRTAFGATDLTQAGGFTIDGINPDDFDTDPETELPEAPASITATTGLFVASEPGTYTVRYSTDFCSSEVAAQVEVVSEDVQALRIEDRSTGQEIQSLDLLLDSSRDLDVLGVLESGREIILSNLVTYLIEDESGEIITDLAFATLRGVGTITAFARAAVEEGEEEVVYPRLATLQAVFDPTPDGDVIDEDGETFDDTISSSIVALRVLEAELVPETLVIEAATNTILPGTGITLTAKADFSGPAGDFPDIDVSKDVQWTTDNTAIATVNNTIGSKGFVFAANQRIETDETTSESELITNLGDVTITARRFSGLVETTNDDGTVTEENPFATVTLSVGRPDPDEGAEPIAPVTVGAMTLALLDEQAPRAENDNFAISALADLVRDDTVVGTQNLAGQVVWDITSGGEFAHISNRSGRKGQVTVLTDQTVTVTFRARYFNSLVQDTVVAQTLDVELNPVGP